MQKVIVNFPIMIRRFEQHNRLKEKLLTAINEQEEYENLVGPNNNITRCDWESARFDPERKWFKLLKQPLDTHLNYWCKSFDYDSYVIHEIWFQQYSTNSKHAWHVHGANFTNVYYLDLPQGSPKTEWVDPITKHVHEFTVQEGDIITFPSWLIHRAPENFSSELKTIISWNMDVTLTDFYGDKNGNN